MAEASVTEMRGGRFRKRSLSLAGHRTSVSLEEEFWGEIEAAAEKRDMSLAGLVQEIDVRRTPNQNLASALRLFVLEELKGRT
jgi:predicted DNA-binding ribbon-helix-helix protein